MLTSPGRSHGPPVSKSTQPTTSPDTMMQNAGIGWVAPTPKKRCDSMSLPAIRTLLSSGAHGRIEMERSDWS